MFDYLGLGWLSLDMHAEELVETLSHQKSVTVLELCFFTSSAYYVSTSVELNS
jgi:hypothetical protein